MTLLNLSQSDSPAPVDAPATPTDDVLATPSQSDSVGQTSNTDKPWAGQVFIRLNAMHDRATGGEGLPQRSGNTMTVDIESSSTVMLLKKTAQIPDDFRLMYAGRYLSDDATLAACGIQREATLEVLGLLLGGTGGRGTAEGSPKRAEQASRESSASGCVSLHFFCNFLIPFRGGIDALRALACNMRPCYICQTECVTASCNTLAETCC